MENTIKMQPLCISSGKQTQLLNYQNYQPQFLKILNDGIPAYSIDAGPKYLQFKLGAVNSAMAGTYSGLRQVAALSNAINGNVKPVYPVISTTLVVDITGQSSHRIPPGLNKNKTNYLLAYKKQSPIDQTLKPLHSFD